LPGAAAIPKNAPAVQIDRRWISLLLMAATAFCSAAPAVGQDYVVRDAQGRRTRTVDRQGADRYILRDTSRRRTGAIDQSPDGRLVIRDSHERRYDRTGSVQEPHRP
jgi:hypothetical protein